MELEGFLLVALFLLACYCTRLSARIKKCESLLAQLNPKPSTNTQTKKPPSPSPAPLRAPPEETKPPLPKKPADISKPLTKPAPVKVAPPKVARKKYLSSSQSFRIPGFIQENWMAVFGSIALVMGTVFFGLTANIMHHPQSRVAVMFLFSLMLFGISRKLKKNRRWTLFRGWLHSIASTVILFATLGAGGIKGLQFIDSPLLALGFLTLGITLNIFLASITPSQTVASFHVILSLIAFCTAPQSFILLLMGTLVVIIGLVNAYRARWDVHLLLILAAFAFQNFYLTFMLKAELLPWMHTTAILCSVSVGVLAGLIHYSKKYKSPKFEAVPFLAHTANWGFLTFNICLHASFFKGVPLILAGIALSGFILARIAKKRGITWLYYTDTLFSQLASLAALLSCHVFSLNEYDIGLLILLETMAFTLVFQVQKEHLLVRVGSCIQMIAAFTTWLLIFRSTQLLLTTHRFTLYLRLGLGTALCWGYYVVCIGKKFSIDDPRWIFSNQKEQKNPLSLSVLSGTLFFLSLYACGFNSPAIQSLTLLTILLIGVWRKSREDRSSNLVIALTLVWVHALNWLHLSFLCFQTGPLPSIFSNANYLGLLLIDLLLIVGNFLTFKQREKNYAPLFIYALGIQALLLAYLFTKQISVLIPGLAFLGVSLFLLESAKPFSTRLRYTEGIKRRIEENMVRVGWAALICFIYHFLTVHLPLNTHWHSLSLRWFVEALGLFAILYWIIFKPKNTQHYRPLTQRMLNSLIELGLGFLALSILIEVPESGMPLIWALIGVGLLLISFYANWPKRLFSYAWLSFIVSTAHLAFVQRLLPKGWSHLLTLLTLSLQFYYAYFVHRNRSHIEEKTKTHPFIFDVYRYANFTVLLPIFLGIAFLLAFHFEKTLLTLLWVGLTCIYLTIGLAIKSHRSVQIGMISLILCSIRLIVFDLVQTDLSTRALVFIGVGSLMLGASVVYKKYKHRIRVNKP